MYRYFYFIGILLLILRQSKGEDVFDCKNSNIDCKKFLNSKHTIVEAKASIESNPQEYICQHEGRFPDLSDSSCMRYFQCEKTNNGRFIKKPSKCLNSTFCGLTQQCSSVYACPCEGISNDESIVPFQKSVANPTEKPCSVSPANDFECSYVGRFPDDGDPTCETYFLCSHLYNGSYIKTKYKCQSSLFNPIIRKCSVNFKCPCAITTMTAPPVTITTPTSQYLTSTVVFTLTDASSSINTAAGNETSLSVTTSEGLSTKHGCTINTSKEYECVNAGRFPDFADITCRKYFLCSKLRNGTFIKTSYECQQSSFNPLTLRCSTSYICPCTESHTTGKTTPIVSDVTSLENFTTVPNIGLTSEIIMSPSTIFSSLSTSSTGEETTVNIPSRNPSITESNGITSTIFSEAITPISVTPITNTSVSSSSSSSTEISICKESPDDLVCTSVGRFPDLSDFTCQTYYLCSYLRNGSFVKTKYRCPNLAKFNPPSQKCSTKYICPCTSAITTTVFFTTTDLVNLSTVENATTTVYSESITNLTTPFVDTTISTTSNYICTVPYNIFQCTVSGRFPDFTDVTCRKYFLCSQLQNGTFIKTSYTCLNSTFNPLFYRCSANYVCPCDELSTTSPVDIDSTSEGFTKIPFTSTTTPVVTTVTSTVTTSSYTCLGPTGDTPEFNCASIGRFPDYSDISCRKYFLCSKLHNGTFVKTSYSCPESSCINTNQRCSSTCKCPCL